MVDLSVGTPCDPPPQAVLSALAASGSERGYPSSAGSEDLRQAAANWIGRRFAVDVDPANVAACIGTKEFVASTAWYLRLRDPTRDTVIAPAVAYPTYSMGAQLAGCKVVTVDELPGGGVDLCSVPEDQARRALLVWLNSPSNPTGSLSDLEAAAAWGRAHDVPIFSDECYAEFTWEPSQLSTVLADGERGVVAVHSLSKRSNLAGARVGFYAGDPDLVGYLSAVRQHAGLMVPGPIQAAAVAALDDDEHVVDQRERYLHRLERLCAIFCEAGLDARLPGGGFYLWLAVPSWALQAVGPDRVAGAWIFAEALAEAGGVLVSPGDLYGEQGARFVRVAAVQPDERIELVGERMSRSSHPHLGTDADMRRRAR
jgi:aspartate/methionine/tyrosine aminotransferase